MELNLAIQVTKMMEEEIKTALLITLHVLLDIKTMEEETFVFLEAILASLDTKMMEEEIKIVFQMQILVLPDTKMMEEEMFVF